MSDAPKADIAAIARKHGFGEDVAETALAAIRAGHGRQAQFDHPELGGLGQWSAGGMTMIGDMFNTALKAKVAALFEDLHPLAGEDSEVSETSVSSPSRWHQDLGVPSSTGSQNDMHYAVFPMARRLAIETRGTTTYYVDL